MLDLVVQTAIPEIGEGAGFDIAGSKHLLAQEVQPAVFVSRKRTLKMRKESAASSSNGKIRKAWYFTVKRRNPCLLRAASSVKAKNGTSMSGSRSTWVGCLWCLLCLSIHQLQLQPTRKLPTINPQSSVVRVVRNNCR